MKISKEENKKIRDLAGEIVTLFADVLSENFKNDPRSEDRALFYSSLNVFCRTVMSSCVEAVDTSIRKEAACMLVKSLMFHFHEKYNIGKQISID